MASNSPRDVAVKGAQVRPEMDPVVATQTVRRSEEAETVTGKVPGREAVERRVGERGELRGEERRVRVLEAAFTWIVRGGVVSFVSHGWERVE
jgi:hypothetical protein